MKQERKQKQARVNEIVERMLKEMDIMFEIGRSHDLCQEIEQSDMKVGDKDNHNELNNKSLIYVIRAFYRVHIIKFIQNTFLLNDIHSIYVKRLQFDNRLNAVSAVWTLYANDKKSLRFIFDGEMMQNTEILQGYAGMMCCGFVRAHQSKTLYIPDCIQLLIFNYYQISMSFKNKISDLTQNQFKSINYKNGNLPRKVKEIETYFSTILNAKLILQRKKISMPNLISAPKILIQKEFNFRSYPTLPPECTENEKRQLGESNDDKQWCSKRKPLDISLNQDFIKLYEKNIEDLYLKLSEFWKNMYLSNELSSVEYTTKMEQIQKKCNNYYFTERIFDNILLPKYINAISEKYKNDYKLLVKYLSKNDLKRIHRLFRKINRFEANKLNQAFLNRRV